MDTFDIEIKEVVINNFGWYFLRPADLLGETVNIE